MAAAVARSVVARGGGSSSLRRLFSSFPFASPQPAVAPPPPAEPSTNLFVSVLMVRGNLEVSKSLLGNICAKSASVGFGFRFSTERKRDSDGNGFF